MNESKVKISEKIERLIQVNDPNPEVVRRGRLLNILMLSTLVAAIAAFGIGLVAGIIDGWVRQDNLLLTIIGAIGALFLVGLYLLHRSGLRRWAPVIFVFGSVVLVSFSDEPQYLIAGRSTISYIVPIIMAGVLLRPTASFVVAILSSISLLAIALANNFDTDFLSNTLPAEIVLFLLIATVGWLSARSLENALAELRTINRELDHRVAARTHDLAEALIKVQAEAGKNQAILESIADGVIVFDDQDQATVANPAIGHLLDLPPNRILGRNLETLMHGAVSEADRATVAALLHATERRPPTKFQWAKKTLSASFAPVQLGEGSQRGAVGVFRDFTREAELDRMKSVFVSMVSHELRTPLNAILGYSEILRERIHGPLTDRQAGLVERLITNTRRLLSLVSDLLDRTQLEAGKLSLRISTVSPTTLVDEVVAIFGSTAQAKGLELKAAIAPEVPPQLRGDPQRLGQILINLVGNAIKFTDRGHIQVNITRPDATHWLMTVSDTGCGIPADEQAHVFDWFQQVDSSVTREHTGVGLGLSIVKQLVLLMGGEIALQSEVGQGSTFVVRLPLMLAEEKTA